MLIWKGVNDILAHVWKNLFPIDAVQDQGERECGSMDGPTRHQNTREIDRSLRERPAVL